MTSNSRIDGLKTLCPDVDERLIAQHVQRLDETYFRAFPAEMQAQHLRGLAGLDQDHPVELLFSRDNETDSCTVLGFDHNAAFSLITGVLASVGFSVISGEVFTYSPGGSTAGSGAPVVRRPMRQRSRLDPLQRRRIIDQFSGRAEDPDPWMETLRERLETVMLLLESERPEAPNIARHRVNEWVTDRLRSLPPSPASTLYPVRLEIDNSSGSFTRLRVHSQDTPAFLYSFSTALALHGLSIERVRIATRAGAAYDEIDVRNAAGGPITDPRALALLRVSAALTKQFTYFLDQAPDPYTALERFKWLVEDVLTHGEERWLDTVSDPQAMHGLASVLGASDFLWEDFVRVQYETLLPFLRPRAGGKPLGEWLDEEPRRLPELLHGITAFEEKRRVINAFKDREAFLIDVEQITSRVRSSRRLAERLTSLAELLLNAATSAVADQFTSQHGQPLLEAGEPCRWSLLGLGKLGGSALGYASDLELLLVYEGAGRTNGAVSIANADYFAQLVLELQRFIEAKRDGLFEIDLKLRPFGRDGPLACSLESFSSYYGPGGRAHSLERLSLTRLRAVGGDPELGRQVERLRDELVYGVPSLNLEELRQTRQLQFEQKTKPGFYNAKYSPGALVDIEYATQILQVLYGKENPGLRTPRIEQALEALRASGVLEAGDLDQLLTAYDFFGRLINALRMLRGWADDLFLPAPSSEEFSHLARRMGYTPTPELDASRQLYVELQSRAAVVRSFVERRFGPSGLPGHFVANVADLILADRPPVELRARVLQGMGLTNVAESYSNLRRLAGEDERRDVFAELAVLAGEILPHLPDPDLALERWRRQVDELPDPEAHFRQLRADPRQLHRLLAELSRPAGAAST